MVDAVDLHLVKYLVGVLQRLGDVGEQLVHLLLRLEPLLLAVEHHVLVGEFFARRDADESLMGIGILLVDEVAVVGADELDVQFAGKLDQRVVDQALLLVGLMVGASYGRLVALQLQIVVVAEHALEPLDRLTRLIHLTAHDHLRHLAAQAGRAADDPLMVLLQLTVVGPGVIVHALGPRVRHDLDKVLVPLQVLGQQDQVIAVVSLVDAVMARVVGDIHLAAEDGFELFLALLTPLTVHLAHIVVELLDAEHVAVVGNCHAPHAVGYSLVNHRFNGRHAVKDRVLRVYV